MTARNKYHFLFLLMLMLTLSSCDTTQVTEDEDGFSDDTFLSDSDLYDAGSTNEKSGTFIKSYSEQGVLCGSDIVDFPDQSFVAKFRIGDKDFTTKNFYEYARLTKLADDSTWDLSGLDIEKMLQEKNKLYLPFEMFDNLPEEELNIYVDWGDGSCHKVTGSDELTHNYEKPGDYQVKVIGSGFFLGGTDYIDGTDLSPRALTYRLSLFEVVELGDLDWKYLYASFALTPGLSKFSAKHADTSNVVTMFGMFYGTVLKEIDLSGFNFSSLGNSQIGNGGTSSALKMFSLSQDIRSIKLPAFDGEINNIFYNKSTEDEDTSTLFKNSNINITNSSSIIDCGNSTIKLDDATTWNCREEANEDTYCHHPGISNSDHPHSISNVYSNETKEISFNCLDGYHGGGVLTCDPSSNNYEISSGTKCVPMSCASTSVANSNRSSLGIISGVVGRQVEVSCDEGYWGGGVWTCHADRVFKGRNCLPNSYITSNSKVGVNCGGDSVNFPDHSMVLEYSVTPGTEITLPLNDREVKFGGSELHAAELDLYIDWGDSNCDRVQSPVAGVISHSYNINSNVIVRVTGKALTTKTVGSSAGNLKKVINLGDLKLKSYQEAFHGAEHLTNFLHDEHKAQYSNVSRGLDFSFMLKSASKSLPAGVNFNFGALNFSAGYLFNEFLDSSGVIVANFEEAKAYNAIAFSRFYGSNAQVSYINRKALFGEYFYLSNAIDLSHFFHGPSSFSKIVFKNFNDSNIIHRELIVGDDQILNPSKKIYCGGHNFFVNKVSGVESNVNCFSKCSFDLGTELLKSDEGDVVDITCSDGYELSPLQESLSLTCNFGGFNRDDVSCVPKTCSQNIAFGNNISKEFSAGAAVVTCDEGYTPNFSQVTCQADGKFDQEVACIKDGASFLESYASNEILKCNNGTDDASDDINVVFSDDSFVQVVGDLSVVNPFVLPNNKDGDVLIDYYVDWGDGNCSHIEPGVDFSLLSHFYAEASDKTIRITGVVDNWGEEDGNLNYYPHLKSVINLGDVGWTDLSYAFQNATALESFSALYTDTSQVTSMKSMFKDCNNTNFTSLDLSNFVTTKVTNMDSMLDGTSSLSTLDINNFSYNEVISYTGMFSNTDFESLNLGIFLRPKPEVSIQEIFSGSNIITGNSRGILSCGTNNEDGDVANGYDIIINSVRYPCETPDATCELAVSNLIAGETISATTEFPTIVYGCEAGYATSHASITCRYDTNFEESNISCVAKSCDDKVVSNTDVGELTLSGGIYNGATQTVTCDSGYIGGGEWACALKGDGSGNVEWQGQACESMPCDFAVKNSEESVVSIVHGETANVTCLPGFVGGGEYSCNLGVENGVACTDDSTDYVSPSRSYIEENYHCDLNQDSIEDPGEIIDFPDHSFVITFVVHENDGLDLGVPSDGGYDDDNPEDDWKIVLPSTGGGLHYYVDWGDGECQFIDSASASHSYENSSRDKVISTGSKTTATENAIDTYEYQVRVIGRFKNLNGNLSDSNSNIYYKDRLRSVISMGDVGWSDLSGAFAYIKDPNFTISLDFINTKNVTKMGAMFEGLSQLSVLNLNPINGEFDTSNVTEMYMMFYGLENLTTLNLNLTGDNKFVTTNVESMNFMFAGLEGVTSLNLNLDAPNVFNTENTQQMNYMFSGMTSLGNLNLNFTGDNKFDTSNVEHMKGIFRELESLTELDLNLTSPNKFTTQKVTSMKDMFRGLSSLETLDLNLSGNNRFDTSMVTSMTEMFLGMNSLTSLDLDLNTPNKFDTSGVKSMAYMFTGMNSLTSLDLALTSPNKFDTSIVEYMNSMFSGMTSLTYLNLGADFNVNNVGEAYFANVFSNIDFISEGTGVYNPGFFCEVNSDGDGDGDIDGIPDNGYEIIFATGTAGEKTFQCSGKPCAATEVANSNKSEIGSITGVFEQTVDIECDPGYEGSGSVTCQANQTFSSLSCDPVSCPDLTPSNSSTLLGAANFEASPESVTCDAGFVGGGDWICSADGVWTGPSCDRCQLAVSNLSNDATHLKAGTDETLSVECSVGFASVVNEVTCAETTPGVFGFDQVPVCSVANCTIAIDNLADSKTHLYGVDGGSADVSCDSGYEASVSSINCTGDTFEQATCNPMACSNFIVENTNSSDPLDDVKLSGVFGESQTVICDEASGYGGGGDWQCSIDGENVSWQGGGCQFSQCEIFVKNSESGILNVNHGTVSNISCLPGFVGGGEWSCNNGVASGSACTDESTDYSLEEGNVDYLSYVEENFHCDLNQDGNLDAGEVVDFPDHSFVATYRVHENDLLNHIAQDSSVTPENDFLVRLPATGNGVNFYVDWGDGNCEKIEGVGVSSANLTHDYSTSPRPAGDKTGILTDHEGSPINNDSGVQITYYDYTVRIVGVVKSAGGGGSTTSTKYYKDRLLNIIELGDVQWESLNSILYQNKNKFKVTFNASFTNTENVSSFNYFINSDPLTVGAELNLTGLNTINALSLDKMLKLNGNTLRTVDLSSFDTPRNETLDGFLSFSFDLEKLSIVNFDTSNVYNFSDLLYRSCKLESLDLSTIDSLKAHTMRNMLNLTTSLKRINFGNWEIQSIPSAPENNEGHDKIFDGSSIENQILNKKDDGIDIYCHDRKTNLFFGSPQFLSAAGDRQLTENAANGAVSCDGHPPMIVTFKTTTENESVTLGISGGVDVRVFWDDFVCSNSTFSDKAACEGAGASWDYREEEIVSTDNPTHTFVEPGEYTVWISGYYSGCDVNNENCSWNTGSFSTINSNWSNNLYQVDTFGDLEAFGVTSMASAFANNTSLERVYGYINLPSTLTDLSSLFKNATNLKRVDLSQLDTTNVTSLNSMFKGASSLEIVDLGEWEGTSTVPSTENFFQNASTVNEANSNDVLRCSYHVAESEKTAHSDGGIGSYTLDSKSYSCWDPVAP